VNAYSTRLPSGLEEKATVAMMVIEKRECERKETDNEEE